MLFLFIISYLSVFVLILLPNEYLSNSAESLQQLSKANNEFGLYIFRLLSSANNNDIISPVSLLSAFSILYNGANSKTQFDLSRFLKFEKNSLNNQEINEGFKQLLGLLSPKTQTSYQFIIANRVLTQNTSTVNPDFISCLKQYFKAGVQSVHFQNDGQKILKMINNWIREKTNNKIEKLFEKEIESSTQLIIINVIYFRGNWLKQFNPSDTIEDTFFNNGMNGTQVKMMSIRNKLWNYTRTHHLNSQFLEMPYSNKDFSLIIILPQHRNGLSKLKRIIKGTNLISAINSMNSVKVDVYLPKFKIEQNYNLKSALSKSPQFKKILNELDLSRINGQKNLIVSEVVHKVVIEVNEKGSEAAAATGVGVLSRSLPEVFRADHPFLYAIRDRRNNLILLLGQINQFNTYTKQKDSILRSRVMSFSSRDEDEDDEDYEF